MGKKVVKFFTQDGRQKITSQSVLLQSFLAASKHPVIKHLESRRRRLVLGWHGMVNSCFGQEPQALQLMKHAR